MPLLSIIIPFYNVENYIGRCLESIVGQGFSDLEVILVNDASTDRSGQICESYAYKYPNFKVIHLESNKLPAHARNVGLIAAEGEYVHFCDSDDHYMDQIFSKIAAVLKQSAPSVLVGQFHCEPEQGAFFANDIPMDSNVISRADANEMAGYLLELPNLLCTPWRFVVRRDLLLTNNIFFPEGYHAEDEEWVPKVICNAHSFAHLPEPFYCYRPRAMESLTSAKTYLHTKSHLYVSLNLLRFLREKNYQDKRRDLILSRVNFLMGLFSSRCDTLDRNQLQELAGLLEDQADLFPMLKNTAKGQELVRFIEQYGTFMGLCLYRTYVIENTLQLAYGKEEKSIYVFPTGYHGEGSARILQQAGYKVEGFLDNSSHKKGCSIGGIIVYSPAILKDMDRVALENIFVMISHASERVSQSIKSQLLSYGLHDSQIALRSY